MSVKEKSAWKSIPIKIDYSGRNDLISFEELDDYDVIGQASVEIQPTTSTQSSNKKKKRRLERIKELKAKRQRLLETDDADSNPTDTEKPTPSQRNKSKKNKNQRKPEQKPAAYTESVKEEEENEVDVSAWDELLIPDEAKRALKEMGFGTPTQIQKEVIKTAIQSKMDIVAAAETGSGKTLAFGIPLLYHMMDDRIRGLDKVVPDVADDIELEEDEVAEDFDMEEMMSGAKETSNTIPDKVLPTLVLAPTRELVVQVKDHLTKVGKYTGFKMVPIVGGMSVQKQERLLKSKPDIIIATPGRLWEFVEQGNEYLSNLHLIRYLVIDEADRMLEKGHFDELVKILDVLNGKGLKNVKRQTYMFSATLTMVHRAPNRLKAKGKVMTKTVKLETLMAKIGIKEKRHVVDLSTKKGTATNLYEAKIICSKDEKDLYMYYFIRSHPGRTLVFTNSIDCIFHVTGVLQALHVTPLQLHAKMQQRQRLKHLERFRANDNSVLIASDVAARGLDIPDVQHVIHYQVPRACETYIHRSGRSARTGKEGLSLLLVSPEELSFYKRLCASMKLESGIPQFPYDEASLAATKKIVKLAKEVDALGHSKKKVRLNNDWFSKAAAEMDIELDDDILIKDDDADEKEVELQQKQKQLDLLLERPILPKWFSGKYLTKSGKVAMPMVQKKSAIEEVKKALKSR